MLLLLRAPTSPTTQGERRGLREDGDKGGRRRSTFNSIQFNSIQFWPLQMAQLVDEGSEFTTIEASVSSAESDVTIPKKRSIGASAARLGTASVGALVVGVPWALCLTVEEIARCATGNKEYRLQRYGWEYASTVYEDLINLSSTSSAYKEMVWSWPAELLERAGRRIIALTFDDAPGDNPEAFAKLLDVLKVAGVRATFFCMTITIEAEGMDALMRRIIEEGHEICNHGHEDKSLGCMGESAFIAELEKAETYLERYRSVSVIQSAEGSSEETAVPGPRRKWFRPPNGQMSATMARVLQRTGYTPILGDVFSNDAFVGGDSSKDVGPKTQRWHVEYCLNRTKPGSVVIFHVPRLRSRLSIVNIAKSYIDAAKQKGFDIGTVSEVADAAASASNEISQAAEAE